MANYGMEEPRKRNIRAEMNIAPMVDIVFTLLIVFMVATPLVEQQGIDLNLPDKSQNLPKTESTTIEDPDKSIVVSLYKVKGKKNEIEIYIEKEPVTIEKLKEHLESNANLHGQGNEEKPVYLAASKDLSYNSLAQIIAVIKNAGVRRLILVTEPLEE